LMNANKNCCFQISMAKGCFNINDLGLNIPCQCGIRKVTSFTVGAKGSLRTNLYPLAISQYTASLSNPGKEL
jgi:hypothetical protein